MFTLGTRTQFAILLLIVILAALQFAYSEQGIAGVLKCIGIMAVISLIAFLLYHFNVLSIREYILNTNLAARYERRASLGYLLCVALLCGLLAGCGNDKVQEDQNDNVSADTIPEDVVVHTDYGDLHYPDRWQEYVTIRQEQNGNTIAVTFETKSGEETYELFKVLIGDDSSEVVGSLTDDTGTQRNVYLHVEELPADSGLEETEQTRFYAMQEDLNYLIDNLK